MPLFMVEFWAYRDGLSAVMPWGIRSFETILACGAVPGLLRVQISAEISSALPDMDDPFSSSRSQATHVRAAAPVKLRMYGELP